MQKKRAARRQSVKGKIGPRNERAVPKKPLPSTTHYRLVFEHDLIGMYRTTLDGHILDCNDSMAKMLGYASRAELLRHAATELYDSHRDRRAFLNDLRNAGTLTNYELRLRRTDGTPVYILENVSLVPDEHGGPATIQGAMVDITERKLAEEALRESEGRFRRLAEELRRLTRHMRDVRERERARIARELHDELGQALTALNMDLHWLRERSPSEFDSSQARVAAMCELVDGTIQALRRICTDLRPTVLDDLGLVAAIEWQAREFESRTGIRCVAALPRTSIDLPKDQATEVFRILQEALTNIARHAQATKAQVDLRVRSRTLMLTVKDNGIGITPEQCSAPHALGLLGMRERAIQWKGQLTFSGERGKGTTVTLRMPLGPPNVKGTT